MLHVIKPIETEYMGYKFRSRLEARWAVFFHHAEIPFLYEPEGYELKGGTKYLPDFYLPKMELFAEVKATKPTDGEQQKLRLLVESTGKRGTFLGVIPPHNSIYYPFEGWEVFIPGYYGGGWDNGYYFCVCPLCGQAGFEFNGRSDRIECGCERPPDADKGCNADLAKLINAYDAARKARFEHGSRG